jgi:hypothetical protein
MVTFLAVYSQTDLVALIAAQLIDKSKAKTGPFSICLASTSHCHSLKASMHPRQIASVRRHHQQANQLHKKNLSTQYVFGIRSVYTKHEIQ